MRSALIWGISALAVLVPLAFAVTSPLLEWRQPVYIAAGLAGVLGLSVMLFQPLLVGGALPGLEDLKGRRWHKWAGVSLVLLVVVHVIGLWVTSPPDLVDALLMRSPTPFSPFGVVAMWAIFWAALLAAFRRRLRLRVWRLAHSALAALIAVTTAAHAVLIDGTMEQVSKVLLSLAVVAATLWAIRARRVWVARASR